MTVRGAGDCVLGLLERGVPARGYAGVQGMPVGMEAPPAWPASCPLTAV
jgi:hypothetical protein